MKKWFLVFAALILVVMSLVYMLIPSNLRISKIAFIHCTANGTYRYLSEPGNWKKWCTASGPANSMSQTSPASDFIYHGIGYKIDEKLMNTVKISLYERNAHFLSSALLIPIGKDSVAVEWKCDMVSGWNPVKRIQRYRLAVRIKKNMNELLDQLRAYTEKPENVYIFPLIKSSTTDTLLITEKHILTTYPTTPDIYRFLEPLKAYIVQSKSLQTGSPMVNVTRLNGSQFQVMVAIPVNRVLPEKGNISPRRMVPGQFMTTTVRGGMYTVNQALDQMQLYFDDYGKTSMAIPFQSLITDRIAQPDTNKWVTKIYAPVFN